MVLARHTALAADGGIPRRLPARFVLSAVGISALSAVTVFMMSVLQEQQRYAAAAVEAYSLVQTAPPQASAVTTPRKTSVPPAQEQLRPATPPVSSPMITGFDLSRSRHWKTIGPLRLRVNRTDVRHGSCDLSVFQRGHRVLNSHVFVAQRIAVPTQLGAPAIEIMVTSIGKNRVSGYVVGASTEHRESTQVQPPKHHLLGG